LAEGHVTAAGSNDFPCSRLEDDSATRMASKVSNVTFLDQAGRQGAAVFRLIARSI
jgi:hypothetical protein